MKRVIIYGSEKLLYCFFVGYLLVLVDGIVLLYCKVLVVSSPSKLCDWLGSGWQCLASAVHLFCCVKVKLKESDRSLGDEPSNRLIRQ